MYLSHHESKSGARPLAHGVVAKRQTRNSFTQDNMLNICVPSHEERVISGHLAAEVKVLTFFSLVNMRRLVLRE